VLGCGRRDRKAFSVDTYKFAWGQGLGISEFACRIERIPLVQIHAGRQLSSSPRHTIPSSKRLLSWFYRCRGWRQVLVTARARPVLARPGLGPELWVLGTLFFDPLAFSSRRLFFLIFRFRGPKQPRAQPAVRLHPRACRRLVRASVRDVHSK
jgi:hypothetical protein